MERGGVTRDGERRGGGRERIKIQADAFIGSTVLFQYSLSIPITHRLKCLRCACIRTYIIVSATRFPSS